MDTTVSTVSGVEVETVEYSHESATVRTQFDHSKTPASMAVIATLADAMDTDPVELTPLHSTVDPEALDTLVQAQIRMNGDVYVTFTHEDHEICVRSYGVISIMLPEDEPPAEKHERAER